VGATRFLVLTSPEEQRLVSSDIPLENCVMVVVLQEMAMYQTLGFDKMVPQNIYYDAAAVADHICLMAHCLGLGSCWLTHGEETQRRLREHFNLSPTMTSRPRWPPGPAPPLSGPGPQRPYPSGCPGGGQPG